MSKEIIFLLPSPKAGGGNRVVFELANSLSLKGIAVEVVFPNNSLEGCPYSIEEGVKLTSVGDYSPSKIKKLFNLIGSLRYVNKKYRGRHGSRIILTDPIMSLFLPILRVRRKYRYVQADDYHIFDDMFIFRSKVLLRIYRLMTKFSFRYYESEFIFNSKYTYECFMAVAGNRKVDFKLVHPAINHTVFYANESMGDVSTKPTIGIFARLHPWKGFIDFIKAIDHVPRSKYSKVYVISQDDLSALPSNDFEIIKPNCDVEIADILRECDIFVSTSWWEGFGLPPLEAMACGCAVVSSKSGGIFEYAEEDRNCLLYEPKNHHELSLKLTRLVDDGVLRNNLIKNSLVDSERFLWDKSADMLLDIAFN